jgi:hypothetical protein
MAPKSVHSNVTSVNTNAVVAYQILRPTLCPHGVLGCGGPAVLQSLEARRQPKGFSIAFMPALVAWLQRAERLKGREQVREVTS